MSRIQRLERLHDIAVIALWSPLVALLLFLTVGFHAYAGSIVSLQIADRVMNLLALALFASLALIPLGLLGDVLILRRLLPEVNKVLATGVPAGIPRTATLRLGMLRATSLGGVTVKLRSSRVPTLVRRLCNICLTASALGLIWLFTPTVSTPRQAVSACVVFVFLMAGPWLLANWRAIVLIAPDRSGWVVRYRRGPWDFGLLERSSRHVMPPVEVAVVQTEVVLITDRDVLVVARLGNSTLGLWRAVRLASWIGASLARSPDSGQQIGGAPCG